MNYSFTLTQQELEIVGTALAELPFKTVAPLLAKINQVIVSTETQYAGVAKAAQDSNSAEEKV